MHKRYHGLKNTPEYNSWRAMRGRCLQKNNNNYENYGGRGIKICKEWDDFLVFLHDMGKRPEGMTLDRINNDGNYEPENCRWATQSEQMSNTGIKSTNKSGFKGVSYRPDKVSRPWQAQICRAYKVKHLGYFDTPEEAAEVYKLAVSGA